MKPEQLNKINVLASLVLVLAVSACTTYDNSLSDSEQKLQDNAKNFQSLSGNLKLDANGDYSVGGKKLDPSPAINGMPTYAPISLNGNAYTVLSAGFDTGRSLYFLSPSNQFTELGSSQNRITNLNQFTTKTFSGKYNEQTMSNGMLGTLNSGSVLLELNPVSGTLTTVYGPKVTYQWDQTKGAFVGTDQTSGQTIATQDKQLLGNYSQIIDANSTNYGVFWALGE